MFLGIKKRRFLARVEEDVTDLKQDNESRRGKYGKKEKSSKVKKTRKKIKMKWKHNMKEKYRILQ